MTMDLRTAMARRKWNQITLARRSHVNQGTVSRMLNGQITNPTIETVRKLEQALGVKRGTLIFQSEDAA